MASTYCAPRRSLLGGLIPNLEFVIMMKKEMLDFATKAVNQVMLVLDLFAIGDFLMAGLIEALVQLEMLLLVPPPPAMNGLFW
jgi:hypothetical protein